MKTTAQLKKKVILLLLDQALHNQCRRQFAHAALKSQSRSLDTH